jgi:lipopolysaccharide biosynthesis glycosyltransferase
VTDEPAIVDVAVAADRSYVRHAGVMLRSLLQQHPRQRFAIHFLHGGEIPGDELARLGDVIRTAGATLNNLAIPPAFRDRLAPHPRFGAAAWYRLLLPDLLPQLSRVLYLDSDLVINEPVDRLWLDSLGNASVGAVTNALYPHQSRSWLAELQVPPDRYFNSGVLVMNLERLRTLGWVERCVTFIEKAQALLLYPDQDVLNALLWRERMTLPPRYNAQITLFDLPDRLLPYPPDESQIARRNPAIVHFIGPVKPWHDASGHPFRSLYWRHLAETPWRGMPAEDPRWFNAVLRQIPLHWQALAVHRTRQFQAQARAAWRRVSGWVRAAVKAYRGL